MPAWYIAMWVNAPDAGDVADRPQPVARPHPLVDLRSPAPCGSSPTVSTPSSPTRAWRPTLTSSSAPRTDVPSSRSTVTLVGVPARPATALAPSAQLDAVRRAGPPRRPRRPPAPRAAAAGRWPRRRSPRAVAGEHLGQLEPDRAAAEHDQRRRARARPRSPRGWSSSGCRPARRSAVRRGPSRWRPRRPRPATKASSPTITRPGPSSLAEPRTSRPPLPSNRSAATCVVPVVGGLVPDPPRDERRGPGSTVAVPA